MPEVQSDASEMDEFDNLQNAPDPAAEQQTEVAETDSNLNKSALDSVMRGLSCLPCLPAYESMPETPNINKVKIIQ